MYVMGENPAMSDPDAEPRPRGAGALEHLVVQDIFLTETATWPTWILPATALAEKTGSFTNTDRWCRWGARRSSRRARRGRTCGSSSSWRAPGPRLELRRTTPEARCSTRCAGDAQHRRHHLGAAGARARVTYPCENEGDPGSRWSSPTTSPPPTGPQGALRAGRHHPAADERPDAEYPMVLITGRQLEHWHTGSMTRRAGVLDAIEPDPTVARCTRWTWRRDGRASRATW
jgi:formate dehydrogenase major subunit